MKRRTVISAMAFTVLLGGCVQRYRPIYNVDRAMPAGVERLSPDRIRDIIVASGKQLTWRMTPIAPGHLEATQSTDKFSATVDIYYTPVRLQIVIKSTINLMQTATTVHAHYNLWVGNLEAGIITNLTLAVPAGSAVPTVRSK